MKKPVIKMIPLDQLFIDDRYQRPLEVARVRKMVREFSWALFGVLETSQRTSGMNAIFDGQHRFEAAKSLGLEAVPCLVHEDLSAEQEAELFTKLQLSRKGLNQIDRFRAQVFAGNPESIGISRIVADLGLTIDRQRHSATSISAIISLERIYRRWGGGHLQFTLRESKQIWAGEDGSLQGAFLGGFARWLAAYGDDRYTDEVRERLSHVLPITLMRRASAVRGGGSQMDGLIYVQLRRAAGIRGAPRKRATEK